MDPDEETSEWIGIADLMSGLVLVFLLLVVLADIDSKSRDASNIDEQVENLDVEPETTILLDAYTSLLHNALMSEFQDELQGWNAVIDPDNTVKFQTPNAYFESGSSTLQPRFIEILNDFFPRYASILHAPRFRNKIVEIRIEGHTSEEWETATTEKERYINNVRLSQDRAFNVLEHSFATIDDLDIKPFLTDALRAVGMSYAKQCYTTIGSIDKGCSRRVEYRVIVEHDKTNVSSR